MISRFLLALGLAALMVVTGITSFMYVNGRQSRVAVAPLKPTQAAPRPDAFTLPGTLYLAQSGALYSLSAGRFHQLTPQDGWTQPSLFATGNFMVAVKRSQMYSDIYVLNRFGQQVWQLTSNAVGAREDPTFFHWSFYPHLSADGSTLYMSYDDPKYGYDVNLSVWAMPYGGTIRQGRLWTNSNDYTGGDIQPIPLATGGVMYTKYDYGPGANLIGQIFVTTRAGSDGRPLTTTDDDCAQPSVSPDGHEVAMICTYGKQVSHLVIAPFDGSYIGPHREVITDQLVAQPIWAPDGSGIAYLAPGAPAGPFQLWFLPRNAYHPPVPTPIPTLPPTPGGPYTGQLATPSPIPLPPPLVIKPIQVTTNLGLDASSPLAWSP
jgi:hypothetical protein